MTTTRTGSTARSTANKGRRATIEQDAAREAGTMAHVAGRPATAGSLGGPPAALGLALLVFVLSPLPGAAREARTGGVGVPRPSAVEVGSSAAALSRLWTEYTAFSAVARHRLIPVLEAMETTLDDYQQPRLRATLYEEWARLEPYRIDTRENLTEALVAAGEPEQAEECLRDYLKRYPYEVDGWLALAAFLAEQQALQELAGCVDGWLDLAVAADTRQRGAVRLLGTLAECARASQKSRVTLAPAAARIRAFCEESFPGDPRTAYVVAECEATFGPDGDEAVSRFLASVDENSSPLVLELAATFCRAHAPEREKRFRALVAAARKVQRERRRELSAVASTIRRVPVPQRYAQAKVLLAPYSSLPNQDVVRSALGALAEAVQTREQLDVFMKEFGDRVEAGLVPLASLLGAYSSASRMDAFLRQYSALLERDASRNAPCFVRCVHLLASRDRVGEAERLLRLFQAQAPDLLADQFAMIEAFDRKRRQSLLTGSTGTRQLLRYCGSDLQLYVRLAELLVAAGLNGETDSVFAVALANCPFDEDDLPEIIDLCLKAGQLRRAGELIALCLEKSPDDEDMHVRRAELLLRRGEAEAGGALLVSLLDPEGGPGGGLYDRFFGASCFVDLFIVNRMVRALEDTEERVDVAREFIENHLADGETPREFLEGVWKAAAEPARKYLWLGAAEVADGQGDEKGVEALLRKGLRQFRREPDLSLRLAELLEGQDRQTEAIDIVSDAAGASRDRADLWERLRDLYDSVDDEVGSARCEKEMERLRDTPAAAE